MSNELSDVEIFTQLQKLAQWLKEQDSDNQNQTFLALSEQAVKEAWHRLYTLDVENQTLRGVLDDFGIEVGEITITTEEEDV